ncbi:MAG: GMC family oxidoreductase [Alphaproteobacteria bacterium]|nr:GMC family oxidoreductase [Alphaproteobacteria bacterium]
MFLDAPDIPAATDLACDLCIVGAGAAGITLAREFIGAGWRVIVLESGGLEPEGRVQDLYRGELRDPFYEPLDATRLRYFGGTTNHWAGFCRILDAVDFRRRDGFPHSGWPFGRDELIPYYRRAHPICGLGPFAYDLADWADGDWQERLPFDPARLVDGVYHTSAPLRFGTAYRAELERADDVEVHFNANLVDIETGPAARHADALVVATLDGGRYRVRPRHAVLAAGGIENARLLLNADRAQPGGLGNGRDLVGRYFMDHPLVFGTADLVPADPHIGLYLYGGVETPTGNIRAVTTMAEALIEGNRLPNVVITWTLHREFAEGAHSASVIYRSLRDGSLPDDIGLHLGRVLADLDDVALTTYRKVAGAPTPLTAMTAHCRVEPVPDADSRVTLTAERDPLGLRRVRLDWRPGPAGVRALHRILEMVALEAGRTGFGRANIKLDTNDPDWPGRMRPSNHHIGTTRMDDDPSRGVVDRDSRIHGIDNLYVAGSSVFPAAGPNNPTLTIVALALRLADHLKARL